MQQSRPSTTAQDKFIQFEPVREVEDIINHLRHGRRALANGISNAAASKNNHAIVQMQPGSFLESSPMTPTILIYGANGYTGKLASLGARDTQPSFEIAGRNAG